VARWELLLAGQRRRSAEQQLEAEESAREANAIKPEDVPLCELREWVGQIPEGVEKAKNTAFDRLKRDEESSGWRAKQIGHIRAELAKYAQ